MFDLFPARASQRQRRGKDSSASSGTRWNVKLWRVRSGAPEGRLPCTTAPSRKTNVARLQAEDLSLIAVRRDGLRRLGEILSAGVRSPLRRAKPGHLRGPVAPCVDVERAGPRVHGLERDPGADHLRDPGQIRQIPVRFSPSADFEVKALGHPALRLQQCLGHHYQRRRVHQCPAGGPEAFELASQPMDPEQRIDHPAASVEQVRLWLMTLEPMQRPLVGLHGRFEEIDELRTGGRATNLPHDRVPLLSVVAGALGQLIGPRSGGILGEHCHQHTPSGLVGVRSESESSDRQRASRASGRRLAFDAHSGLRSTHERWP